MATAQDKVKAALEAGLRFRNLGYDNGRYRIALENPNGYRHIVYDAYIDHRLRVFKCYPPRNLCRRNCSFDDIIIWEKFTLDERLVRN